MISALRKAVGIAVSSLENKLRMPNSTYREWTLEYYINVQDKYASYTIIMVTENCTISSKLKLKVKVFYSPAERC